MISDIRTFVVHNWMALKWLKCVGIGVEELKLYIKVLSLAA